MNQQVTGKALTANFIMRLLPLFLASAQVFYDYPDAVSKGHERSRQVRQVRLRVRSTHGKVLKILSRGILYALPTNTDKSYLTNVTS